jgi:hypothetical protein
MNISFPHSIFLPNLVVVFSLTSSLILVRAAAAEILPYLLECVKCKGPNEVSQMWSYISEKLIEAIPLEPDTEITGLMINSLSKCIDLIGINCFTNEQYSKIADIVKEQISSCFVKLTKRQDKRQQEDDYDEEVEAELEAEDEDDDYIMRKIADLMHSLFGTHGSSLLPLFDELLPIFANMLESHQPSSYKQWALCIFDDLLDFASQVISMVTIPKVFLLKKMPSSNSIHSIA